MKNIFKKRYMDWNPITSPVIQNTILGFVVGAMVGINLKVLYARIQGPTIIWILFFLFGITIGFLSGIERSRSEDRKRKKSLQKRSV
jgi:uncharacterized integral membrane protein